ncbi:MAG: hypothetical protein FI719_07405 [SAR202 cluster bacterium]|nr:hypothetical protein [SAR202 cluster bacterium]|tara:strand:+ start:1730 stop:2383 length:654 start_codon:yes stop_codon:yes gene_type:complete
MKTFVNQLVTLIFSAALLSGVLACGGSDDGSGSSATTTENNPANTNNKDDENNLMFQQEKISPVIGAPLEEATVAPSPTIEKKVEATPTPTPPSKTIDEKSTGGLVDELSADDFTRTSARDLEKEFRKSPDTATPKIGKKFVVQGNVLEAGTDAGGESYVSFKAGNGRVTCIFEIITDAELRRFTPDGTNSVVGTIDTWDADNRILTLTNCNIVLGY